MNQHQEGMLVQAIQYARRGWHVFPCSYNKRPIPSNGHKAVTTDEETIIQWWEVYPKAQIGIRTGRESGFWVTDIDCKNGKDGLKTLQEHFGSSLVLKDGLFQKTPSGGFHLCFKFDENEPVGCRTGVLEGVDIKGDGGYIIAAPSSVYVNGEWAQYRWKDPSKDPTEAPAWAKQLARSDSLSIKPILPVGKMLREGVPEGTRDESLFRFACLMEREGVDCETAKVIISLVAERCTPPFSETEAIGKVERAYTQYATTKGVHGDRLARIKKAIAMEAK